MRSDEKSARKTWRRLCLGLICIFIWTLAGNVSANADQGLGPVTSGLPDFPSLSAKAAQLLVLSRDWYLSTPPAERICWGGLVACAALGAVVLIERVFRLKRRRIIPNDFTARFLDRLHEGKLDGGKALDYCEMNPSPAARVALAAVRRWGRPAVDMERAVSMAHHVEADRLWRNVGTLRRIAVIAPLLGLLGTLNAMERILRTSATISEGVTSWGPAVSGALSFLTVGITIATLSVVAYDALSVRIERLSGAIDRLGAETIDAIAMTAAAKSTAMLAESPSSRVLGIHSGHDVISRPASASDPMRHPRRPGESRAAAGRQTGHDLGS